MSPFPPGPFQFEAKNPERRGGWKCVALSHQQTFLSSVLRFQNGTEAGICPGRADVRNGTAPYERLNCLNTFLSNQHSSSSPRNCRRTCFPCQRPTSPSNSVAGETGTHGGFTVPKQDSCCNHKEEKHPPQPDLNSEEGEDYQAVL